MKRKHVLVLCCPKCKCVTFARIWGPNKDRDRPVFDDSTLETLEWGENNGMILETRHVEEEVRLTGCECSK